MYYANASAITASNGDNTFAFFDDFLGTSLNTDKWTKIGNGISLSSSEITIPSSSSDTNQRIYTNSEFPQGILEARIKSVHAGNSAYYERLMWYDVTSGLYYGQWCFFASNETGANVKLGTHSSSGTVYTSFSGVSANTYFRYTLKRTGSSVVQQINGGNTITVSSSYYNGNSRIGLNTAYVSGPSTIIADWIALRKYAVSDPLIFFGAEQSN
jgi:hypothetical protein